MDHAPMPSKWLTHPRVCAFTGAMIGLVVAPFLGETLSRYGLTSWEGHAFAAWAVCASIFTGGTTLLCRRAARARSARAATTVASLAVVLGVVLGMAAAVERVLAMIAKGLTLETASSFFATFVIGAGATLGLGVGVATFLAIATHALFARRNATSLDAGERAARSAGFVAMGALAAAYLAMRVLDREDYAMTGPAWMLAFVAIGAASTLSLLATIRLAVRARWLTRVAAGEVARYRIVARADAPADAATLGAPSTACDELLVFDEDDVNSPYRKREAAVLLLRRG